MKIISAARGWFKVVTAQGWTLFQSKNRRECEQYYNVHCHEVFPSMVFRMREVNNIAYGLA